jgi:glutathione S-transferase
LRRPNVSTDQRHSPYAGKVRIALGEKDIPFKLSTEVPWDSTTSTPKYNPFEKLPVLICEDGSSVYESRFIPEYVELKHPTPARLPKDIDGILAAKRLEVLGDGICDALGIMFFEEWGARQRRRVDGGLGEIARLIGTRRFAVGQSFDLGDIAAGTVVAYMSARWPEMNWREQHPT